MDEGLRPFKVQFDNPYGSNYKPNGDAIEEILFAKNVDDAWTKFYSHSKKKGYNAFNVRIKELSKEGIMDEGLRLYKVNFFHDEMINELKDEIMIFARNEDEAWRKFDIYARRQNWNVLSVKVREMAEEEMKQIDILIPLYKRY